MTRNWVGLLVFVLLLLFLIIYSINFYFLKRLYNEIDISERINANLKSGNDHLIRQRVNKLKPIYKNRNPRLYASRNQILRSLEPSDYDNITAIFKTANQWPIDNEVYPPDDPTVGKLIKALQDVSIRKAQNSPRGTQLKLVFQLSNSQLALFKPQWYKRDKIVTGSVYSGKDRHTSEIVAFYLGAMLNFRWTPIAVGRKVSLKEIYSKGNLELQNTMLIKNNGSKYCVYGKCFYCKTSETVCGDENNVIEGVILYLIPGTISKHRSPWQRTYKENVKAAWELDENYCESIKPSLSRTRLLDLIDVSLLDFLIQNGDRHHYETRNNRLLLLDNGKGFGNPHHDFTDILAPLYQCCIIRKSTWQQLLLYSGGALSETLKKLTKNDILYPLLMDDHYKAIERRLMIIYTAVELCKERYGNDIFK